MFIRRHAAPGWPLAAAALLTFGVGGLARADTDVPLDTAIEEMEILAGRIGSARWTVETAHGTLSDNGKFTPNVIRTTGEVIFEPPSGRYRAHLQSIRRAEGGPEPTIAERNICTFDGSRSRIFIRHNFGRAIPAIQGGGAGIHPGFGKIWDNTDEFQTLWGWSSGVGYFPPNFEKDRLPDLLRRERSKGRLARVTEDDQGLWHIEVIDDANAKSLKRVDYDRSKGGVVLGAVWKMGNPLTAFKQITVELQQIDGSYWVPKKVDHRFVLDKPVSVDYVFFRDVKLNRPVGDSDLQLQFPAGSQVVDYAEKKAYVVGGQPKDEQAMIRSFMQMTGMRPPPPPPALWKRILLYGGPAVIVLVASVYVVRRWRGRRATVEALALLVAAAGLSAAPAADPAKPGGPKKDSAEKVHLTQCGFQVTVFALETFAVEYDIDGLAETLLPAGFEGIALSKIQQAPRGSRKSASHLLRPLSRGTLPIRRPLTSPSVAIRHLPIGSTS
jgi:hypothetical protein